MKRLLIAALMVSSLAALPSARATCASAGEHGEANVTFTDASARTITIYTAAFGDFLAGPARACDDQSVTLEPTTGSTTITVDDVVVCTNDARAPGFDPFGFGGSIRNDQTDACGVVAVWDGLTFATLPNTPSHAPDPLPVGPNDDGAHAGTLHGAYVSGSYWFDGTSYTIPAGTIGWFSAHGVEARAS